MAELKLASSESMIRDLYIAKRMSLDAIVKALGLTGIMTGRETVRRLVQNRRADWEIQVLRALHSQEKMGDGARSERSGAELDASAPSTVASARPTTAGVFSNSPKWRQRG